MTSSLVRVATIADAERIGAVQANARREAYRDLMPAAMLESSDSAARARQWRANIGSGIRDVFVAVTESGVVGFCSVAPSSDPDAGARTGQVTALYVEPSSWRSGHGRSLLSSARRHAQTRFWTELTLWVLGSNQAARAFYSSQFFGPDGAEKTEGDPPLLAVRYRGRVE